MIYYNRWHSNNMLTVNGGHQTFLHRFDRFIARALLSTFTLAFFLFSFFLCVLVVTHGMDYAFSFFFSLYYI
jgi:hypothetical protein